jgi:methylglutaconyl-CoA hydratase
VIKKQVEAGIGRVVLARPEVRNALSAELMKALDDALDEFERNDDVRVVVLAAEGRAFSAGADLSSMKRIGTSDQATNRADALEMGRLFHRVAGFPKPVIAAVAGPAVGGGVGLMAACDVVIAVESAFFQFSEVRLGLVPAMISPFCIRRLGPAAARRLFLTGERIDARAAAAVGLVDEVVAAEALEARVVECAIAIGKGAPQALAAAKRLVDEVNRMDDSQALGHTADLIARLRSYDEAQEGMQAYHEKRTASWVRG